MFSAKCWQNKINEQVRRTFVDTSEAAEVHLIGAVEDDDVLAQAAAHVLGRLGLTSTSRPGRCATHRHAQGLSQGDVASASRRTLCKNVR